MHITKSSTFHMNFLFLLMFNGGLSRGSRLCRPRSKDSQLGFKWNFVEVVVVGHFLDQFGDGFKTQFSRMEILLLTLMVCDV